MATRANEIAAAQKIIRDTQKFLTKARWAKGAEAYDADESEVDVHDASAEKFCMIGGLKKIGTNKNGTSKLGFEVAIDAVSTALGSCGDGDGKGIPDFNDNEASTHAQMQKKFDQAGIVLEAQAALARAGVTKASVRAEGC